jgi:hypothetical protein
MERSVQAGEWEIKKQTLTDYVSVQHAGKCDMATRRTVNLVSMDDGKFKGLVTHDHGDTSSLTTLAGKE